MDLGLKDKVAWVGGSSRGLGFAVARQLLAEGAKVALSGRDPARLEGARELLADEFGSERVAAFPGDLGEAAFIEQAIGAISERFGRIDIAVANAGGPPAGPVVASGEADWARAFELHLLGAFRLARTLVPRFVSQGWGRLLFVTSVSVKQPLLNLGISNSIRAGVAGLAKTLALETRHPRVTVNCVLPGYTGTERLDELSSTLAARQGVDPGAIVRGWEAEIPLGRIADPPEFAQVVAFLVSEAASYVNGVALAIDGGLSRSVL